MSWFLFSLASIFLLGVGQVFIKKGYLHFSPLWNATLDTIISFVIYIPVALLLGVNFHFQYVYFFIIIFIAALYTFFYYAIENGQISLSGTIFASYPVATIILSSIFFHERINGMQFLMMCLIIVGGILLSYERDTLQRVKQYVRSSWLWWALFGALATGVGDFFAKLTLNNIEINTYLFLFPIAFLISSTFFWLFDKKGRKFPKKITVQNVKWTVIGTGMLSLGVLSITYAFALGKASLVSTISSGYIGITVLLAYFFLHEKINKLQLIGILLMFCGVTFVGWQ